MTTPELTPVESSPESDWTDLLFEAVHEDEIDIARHAIAQGADVNALRDDAVDLATPLYWAASGGKLEMARLLLESGATVGAEPDGAATALHAAVDDQHSSMIDLLLSYAQPAALNRYDSVGHTPLTIACIAGHVEIARMVLKAGADVDAWDQERLGQTALRDAIGLSDPNPDIIRLLLDYGADVNEGGRSDSPLSAAGRRKRDNGLIARQMIEDAAKSRHGHR